MKFLVLVFALSLSANSFAAEKTKKIASSKSSSTKTWSSRSIGNFFRYKKAEYYIDSKTRFMRYNILD